jgi:hypothetical protein
MCSDQQTPQGAAMDRDALIQQLAKTIASDSALLLDRWTHLVLVSQIEADTPDMTGFCYTEDGRAVPVSPSDFGVFNALEKLRDAMAQADGKEPWVAALFCIERATGKFAVEFEYKQPGRWAVTPDNVKARAREFAPK